MTDSYQELWRLLDKVYRERGFDFREYRVGTLTRRVGRRVLARGTTSYSEYARVLDRDPSEYEKLFNDLTINVTSFFRDEVAFKALEEVVLPALIDQSPGRIRVWSAGCATGQEPCSIAMILNEALGQDIDLWDVTIFGTDIDANALERASEGVFERKNMETIPGAWVTKYFVPEAGRFRVQPVIQRLLHFARHNLVSDPPYHDLDLIVCRNVLIYFSRALQARVLKSFHEGLKGGGFLLLGKSETPPELVSGLFKCVDRKAKVYRRGS